jgi:hypothetical protein
LWSRVRIPESNASPKTIAREGRVGAAVEVPMVVVGYVVGAAVSIIFLSVACPLMYPSMAHDTSSMVKV